jgi:2-desacetyl-2-hydroxyethyl bacteriochlorophyllide A dehydrogenase
VTGVQATAFWINAPGEGELRAEAVPEPGSDEVLVHARYGAISRGTEAMVFQGRVPPSEYSRMRAPFQQGDFPGPVKYGYISVGEVERGPDAFRGQMVFCLHPHQTCYTVPVDAVVPIPPGVPPERAVLAANLETAVNGLWDLAPKVGDRISVIGAGVVGCLCAWLAARIPGSRVELIDTNPERAAVASRLGAVFELPADASHDVDGVIHCSGHPAGLATALRIAGFEATVLEMSWYGTAAVELPLGEAFHARRLVLRSSQVGAVAAPQRGRWNNRRRLGLALDLLTDPKLDSLITGESPFDELPTVMARMAAAPAATICHRIRYS